MLSTEARWVHTHKWGQRAQRAYVIFCLCTYHIQFPSSMISSYSAVSIVFYGLLPTHLPTNHRVVFLLPFIDITDAAPDS
jgi:hypothetical protein